MFKEENQVDPGLDTKMCVMVGAECIASVVDRSNGDAVPSFVKDEPALRIHIDAEYEGYFRVAISSFHPGTISRLERFEFFVYAGGFTECYMGRPFVKSTFLVFAGSNVPYYSQENK